MLSILLCWWLNLFIQDDTTASIKSLFAAKEAAIQTKDFTTFLKTIYPDKHYKQEQKHWFMDAIHYVDPNTFQIDVKQIKYMSPNTYQVEIQQSYWKNKQKHFVTFPVIVRRTKTGMKDADSFLFQRKNGNIQVKYTDKSLAEHAYRSLMILNYATQKLSSIYHWKPKVVEVKLYHNPEWFRQSVKLSLPTWAGGWNEARQAIKLVVGEADTSFLKHGLAHEYTHQLVSNLTNDNAAYWLQEGSAMYYEAYLSREKPVIPINFRPFSIHELENLNLETLPNEIATKYYLSCYIRFNQLITRYGEEKVKQLFSSLHQYSYIDLDSAMKQKETNLRTSTCLQKVGIVFKGQNEKKNAG